MQADAIYRGWVRHRRHHPKHHEFQFPLLMLQLDLAHLSEHFERSRYWSLERFNLISFKRSDYLDAPGANLEDAVRGLVAERTGKRPLGPIQIYTQPRIWGLVFNPVTFYWCFSPSGELQVVVAEINTTPWNERHTYVLPVADNLRNQRDTYLFDFEKQFHVSPFMPMELRYRWQFSFRSTRNVIHMTLMDADSEHFDATLSATPVPLNKTNMATMPWRYSFQCGRVLCGIYWQALKLWLKRTPFYSHPGSHTNQGGKE